MRLGTVVVTTENLNNTASITNNPILFAQWDDLALGNAATNGGVFKTITGTAPNRKMVVEWRAVNTTTTGATNLVYQIVLHETTNKIEYIYVTGQDNTTDVSIGMAVGSVRDVTRVFYSVTPNETLANTTYSNMTPNDLVRTWPGNGTIYSFTPQDLPTTTIVPTDFKSLDNAMGAVNWAGAPNTGGYAITVNGGYTEKAANAYATTPTGAVWVKVAGLLLQASGTASNPISISWSGVGAIPIFTNGDGVGKVDYIIGLAGSDYVTIDGLELQDTTPHLSSFTAALHTAANNLHAEIGIGLFKQRYNTTLGNIGSSNVQIKNCNIDLTRWPNVVVNYVGNNGFSLAHSVSSYSRGIYATRYTPLGTGATPTGWVIHGYNRNQGIKTEKDVHQEVIVTGNTINNVSIGIEFDDAWLKSGANFFAGTNNIIGAVGAGNTITNFGPQPAASGTAAYSYGSSNYGRTSYMAGIVIGGQKNFTVEHNNISGAVNESGTTGAPATTVSYIRNLAGIIVGHSGMNQDYPQQAPGFFKKINNNTISNIDATVTTSANYASVYGIVDMALVSYNVPNRDAANASTGNVEITNNTISNLKARSGNVWGISTRMGISYGSPQFYNTLGETNNQNQSSDFFSTNGDVNIKNNTIKQLAQLGNNTYNTTKMGSVMGIFYGSAAKNLYIEDNIIGGAGNDGFVVGSINNTTPSSNNFINSQVIGLRGILVDRGTAYISPLLVSVKNNTITNLDRLAGTITAQASQRSAGASAITIYNGAASNIIENNTITGMNIANGLHSNLVNTGLDVIYAFGKPQSGNSSITVKDNTITGITRNQFGFLTSMAAGSGLNAITRGIRADYVAGNQNRTISGNTIDGMTQTATYATTALQQNTFFTRLIGIDVFGRDAVGDETNIFDNVVTNLTGENWNRAGTLTTIAYTNPYSVTGINARNGQFINIFNNRVCGLSTTLMGSTATDYTANVKGIAGITFGKTAATAPGTKTTLGESVYNNFISELTAPSIGEELAIEGIVYWGRGRFARIAHNTIVLGDPGGGATGRLSTTGNTFGVNGLSINNLYFNTKAYPTIIRNNIISINAIAKGSTGATAFSGSTTGGFNTAWRTPHTAFKKKPIGIDNSTGGNVYFINDDVRNYIYAQGIQTTQSRYYTSGLRNAYGYYDGAPASYVNAANNLVNDVINAGEFFNTQCGLYKAFWGTPEKTSFIDIDSLNAFLPIPFQNSGTTCEDKLKIATDAFSYVVSTGTPVIDPLDISLDKFGDTRDTSKPTAGAHAAPPLATGPVVASIEFAYDPICDGVCIGPKTITVKITPPSGKAITTDLSNEEIPRIYYRRILNNSAYLSIANTSASLSAIVDNNLFYRDGLNNAAGPSGWRFVKPTAVNGSDYTFDIDETLFSGSNAANRVVPTYTIEYFVIATTDDVGVIDRITSWSSGNLSESCPTSVIMNNAAEGTTTVPGPIDDDETPATGLNMGTGSIEGNSVSDNFTIYKGADLTRTIKVGNNNLNYEASGTTAYTAAVVNIPICTDEVVELEAAYKITATQLELLESCITYKLQVASNVGFTEDLETFTQVNDPKFLYTITTAGTKFFRFWLDCGATDAAVTNTQIVQFTATDCPTNTTPVIDDIIGCAGNPQTVTVETSSSTVSKYFWVVNPYGKVYANAPTAQTALTRDITFTPADENENGVWKTYVTNSAGNSVLNAIVKSADYYDGSLFNTNGGSNDIRKGTAFTTHKFIKLNAVSLIGSSGDGTATSGFNIKLFAKNGELLYTQAGVNVADNTAVQIALTNWFIAPGDYVIVIDETIVDTGITGAIATVAIEGPVKFPNTSTPSITIQGGVANELDFDNADSSVANYFVDWDFTEFCSSLEPNRTFNFAITPSSCCTIPVLPTYTIESDLPSSECGYRTYTVTFDNATGAAVTNLIFDTDLDAGQFLVGDSVSNLLGGTTNPESYAGEPNLTIEGMTLPIGTSVLTFQVDVTTLIAVDPNNIFTLENDCPTTKRTVIFPTPTCKSCENGSAKLKTNTAWSAGGASARINNALTDVVLSGTPESGAIKADITVTYPPNVEHVPNSFPRPYGSMVHLTRNDNLNGSASIVTYKVNLKDSANFPVAAKPSFSIGGITKIAGQTTRVKVTGKCGNETINAILTNAHTRFPQNNSYTISENEATGFKRVNSTSIYSRINVVFDQPVTEITIEWAMDRTPVRKYYTPLFIGEMNFECNTVVPEVLSDNLYMQASFENPEVLTCNDAKIKLKITNLNCDTRTINISNSLPSTLEYVTGSLNADGDSYAGLEDEFPVYEGQDFTLSNFNVPSGVSYVYVNVRPTNIANSGSYSTYFNYTVVGGVNVPNPYRSDDDSGAEGYQDITVNYTAVSKPTMPTIVKSVDKCFNPTRGTNLTYTLTINSTSSTDLTNVEISNILEENQKMIEGSVVITGLTGGTFNDLATDDSFLIIEGLTIPANTTNATIVFKVNTQDTNVEFNSFSTLTIDPESECGNSNSVDSNEITIDTCPFCTKDANVAPATDFTNVGITSHGTKQANWPENVPNGFLTLESPDTGFVITRLTTAQRDALTPLEGMLIYNTTSNEFQLFKGSDNDGWVAIQRGCNE